MRKVKIWTRLLIRVKFRITMFLRDTKWLHLWPENRLTRDQKVSVLLKLNPILVNMLKMIKFNKHQLFMSHGKKKQWWYQLLMKIMFSIWSHIMRGWRSLPSLLRALLWLQALIHLLRLLNWRSQKLSLLRPLNNWLNLVYRRVSWLNR